MKTATCDKVIPTAILEVKNISPVISQAPMGDRAASWLKELDSNHMLKAMFLNFA